VKSGKDVPFGVSSKSVYLTPTSPQILKILHFKSRFSLKTQISEEAPPKFVFEYETTHGDFKFGVKNLTGSRIPTVSAHVQQKIR